MKIRARKFVGRCSRHKGYNPAVDGRGAIRGGCKRCELLADIWETSIKLNGLIRKSTQLSGMAEKQRNKFFQNLLGAVKNKMNN